MTTFKSKFELFVGSEEEYLCVAAKTHNQQATLVTSKNIKDFLAAPHGCVYTSLADINNTQDFFALCDQAHTIFYRPPVSWQHKKNNEQKLFVENLLCYMKQFKTVDGLETCSPHSFLSNIPVEQNHSNHNQVIWIAGCSITAGVGVEPYQTWKHKVSSYFNLPTLDLSLGGSSILWQANRLCQSQIKKNDLVFWGISSQNRMPLIDQNGQLCHINSGNVHRYQIYNIDSIDFLQSSSLLYLNVMAIRNVNNFCQQLGAKLVILGLVPDMDNVYDFFSVPVFRQYGVWPFEFVDLGSDKKHPGPVQQQLYADAFIKFYSDLYSKTH